MTYTDENIEMLLQCSKKITKPPSKSLKAERGQLKNDFEVESEDGAHRFACFIRVNERFEENFSIGLDYIPKDEPGSVVLLRCNGEHGPHKLHNHHHFCHIHRATVETIQKGLRPESVIEVTEAYSTYQEAIRYFLKLVHIKGGDALFPINEPELFDWK